ncbi:MAG: hypothetical protein ACNA8P_01385 [Phycisphaerales bacterium]
MKLLDGTVAREALSTRGFVMLAPVDLRTLKAIRDCTLCSITIAQAAALVRANADFTPRSD